MKRNVLSSFLNRLVDFSASRGGGSLFHNNGAAQENALNPWLRLWYGVSSRCVTAGLELRVMILDVIQLAK